MEKLTEFDMAEYLDTEELQKALKKYVDWNKINKKEYLEAMVKR